MKNQASILSKNYPYMNTYETGMTDSAAQSPNSEMRTILYSLTTQLNLKPTRILCTFLISNWGTKIFLDLLVAGFQITILVGLRSGLKEHTSRLMISEAGMTFH